MGMKLTTPQFRVALGNYELSSGFEVECFSSKTEKMDWGMIRIDPELDEYLNVKSGDPAKIELGYDDEYDELLNGRCMVRGTEILVKDDMTRIQGVRIKATFLDATPQDIVRYILAQAGINDYELAEQDFGKRAVTPIDRTSGLAALADINAAWGISQPWFFRSGKFCWGTKEEQPEMYVLEEGSTILSLNKYGTLWEAETLAIPWIHHSQVIEVHHDKFYGTGEVEKTVLRTDRQGAVRMYISFKESVTSNV